MCENGRRGLVKYRRGVARCVAMLTLCSLAMQPASGEPMWLDATDAAAKAAGPLATREVIGKSVEGRDLIVIRLSTAPAQRRAAMLVVAGLDARHRPGPLLAAGVIEGIARDHAAALEHADLWVVPCLNPDGSHRFCVERPRTDRGGNAAQRHTARDDADRDRRVDEDGPVDLNGDGMITQMRIRRPAPGLMRGLVATDVQDADDPRLLRRADAAKGEVAEFAVQTEGRDQDGDGLIAEDGPDGVDLNANFPYHWPEFAGHSGPTPLSEPESLAMVQWMQQHPEIVAVLEFGAADNILSVPLTGKMDPTGDAPITGGILDEDKSLFEQFANRYKDATGVTGVGQIGASTDGSLQGWAYSQLGIASMVTPGCVRPDLIKLESAMKPADPKPEEQDKSNDPTPKGSEDVKWLRFSDETVKNGGVAGFVDWKPFTHPQLGEIEIGGWVPGFKLDASAAQIESAISAQTRAIAGFLSMLPRLETLPPRFEAIGEGVWRISVSARNSGGMPTRIAMGVRARRHADTRWELELEDDLIISGARQQGIASVPTGGDVSAIWVVRGTAGTRVTAKLLSPECGDQSITVTLQNTSTTSTEAER